VGAVIRVGAVDDDRMLREATARWLRDTADIEVTTAAGTVPEFLAAQRGEDVVLLDLMLADGSHPEDNVAQLVEAGFRVLVVSVLAERRLMVAVLRAGAKGYLTKDNDLAALARTIREIADGTHVLSQELAFAMSRDRTPDRPKLSHREQATVDLYARGLSLPAVAAELNVTFASAKGYLQRAKAKYQAVGRPVGSRTELQARLREDRIGPRPDEP
jgi:two-component system, NarL family, nitrate/nitrite response regulator NarL